MDRRLLISAAVALPVMLACSRSAQAQPSSQAPAPMRVGRRRRIPGVVLAVLAVIAGVGSLAWWRARARRHEAERQWQREATRLHAARQRAQAGQR